MLDKGCRDILFFIKSKKSPNKFYDLLLLPEFVAYINDPDILLTLNVLVGTIEGLNLRNMLWHGYLSKHQFHPSYTLFLMFCVLSLPLPSPDLAERFKTRATVKPPRDFRGYVRHLDFGHGATIFPGTTLTFWSFMFKLILIYLKRR